VADNRINIELSVTGDGEVKIKKLQNAVEDLEKSSTKGFSAMAGAFAVFTGTLASDIAIKALSATTDAAKALFNTFVVEGVKAAQEQEAAVNRLNTALIATGQFSKATSDELQDFAGSLEQTSRFSDETIISTQGLLLSIGNLSKDGLKQATQASADLAAVLKVDLETAATLVAKAAEGNVGAFKRYGIQIKEGNTNTETFNNTLKALAKFQGAAEAESKTFEGRIAVLGNTFNNSQEAIGDTIIKNQSLLNVMGVVEKLFQSFTKVVVENKDTIAKLVQGGLVVLIEASKLTTIAIETIVISTLKLTKAMLQFNEFGSAALAKVTPKFLGFKEEAERSAKGVDAINKALANLEGGNSIFDKIQTGLQEMRVAADQGGGRIVEQNERIAASAEGARKATAELSKEQLKLAEEGKKIADEAAKKDPFDKYRLEFEALVAAEEQKKITQQEFADATVAIAQKRDAELAEIENNRAQTILSQNETLLADDKFKNEEKIRDNTRRLQALLNDERLTAKQREDISRALAKQQKTLEDERYKAGADSLNALASLQTAKTKELAAVGKAAAIAQATIDTYKGASGAASALAGIPIVGPALAAVAAAAFIAAGIARVAQISGVPLATGITEVPSGYNNDTFQARLSTGERVVDAGTNQDLKAFLAGSQGMNETLRAIYDRLGTLETAVTVNIGNRSIIDEVREGIRSGRMVNV
jgi:hypothetical protein